MTLLENEPVPFRPYALESTRPTAAPRNPWVVALFGLYLYILGAAKIAAQGNGVSGTVGHRRKCFFNIPPCAFCVTSILREVMLFFFLGCYLESVFRISARKGVSNLNKARCLASGWKCSFWNFGVSTLGKSDRRVFVSEIFLLVEATFGFWQMCVRCAVWVTFFEILLLIVSVD